MEELEELWLLFAVENIEDAEDHGHPLHFNRRNPFVHLSNRQFIRHFRLDKDAAERLIDIVSPHLQPPARSSALDIRTKVLAALKFFASGSYQLDVGSNMYVGMSQAALSNAIEEVVSALNNEDIFSEWVKFSLNLEILARTRRGFFNNFGFPGVVGAIDCTHVAIFPPPTNDPLYPEHLYINRKGYHSINVQLVCDSNMKILNVNAKYPGSTNDQFIFNDSNMLQAMHTLDRNGHTGFHLIGDSGYYLRAWLLTPLEQEPPANSNGARYNSSLCSARSIIERCNGLLKMRFRCLLKHRVLHYRPDKASKIINACVVLHNMCLEFNVPEPNEEPEDEDIDLGLYVPNNEADEIVPANMWRINPDLARGRRKQEHIINTHFMN